MDLNNHRVSRQLAPIIAGLSSERRRQVLSIAKRAESWDGFVRELRVGGFPLASTRSSAWEDQTCSELAA